MTKAKRARKTTEQAPPAAEHRPETHAFAYADGPFMTCPCGAEQDLRLVAGKVARFYRVPGGEWAQTITACTRPLPKPAPASQPALEPEVLPDVTAPSAHVTTLEEALAKQFPEAFVPEIIDGVDIKDVVDDVDLSIACSPVLPRRMPTGPFGSVGDSLIPCDAVSLGEDRYRIYYPAPETPRDVDAETLKVMRARYLLQRQAVTRALYQMPVGDRARWARLYKIAWLPADGSPLAALIQSGSAGPITSTNPVDGPVDIVALMRTLYTAGAAIPEVCPVMQAQPAPEKG